ncbi:P-loop NTPase [Bdellovibrio svalbardensis]|uniref:P-loop NTPase n=1 Tax=Bdellovibrio svalbardensis TaxID=2972972 RepID=A0ABT6DDX4_9BACT|nr:P-loop NTPase [Bdellovibrio svalbardensis]MDG0815039.1 P-loop NTPase [Bdellovibrio svalbardensis]
MEDFDAENELCIENVRPFKTSSDGDHNAKIWVVASGKGGVGKTFVSSSLGITLSKLGHSVVIVDLDLSGANIHTALGVNPSHMNIRHFFEGVKTLQDIVIPTQFSNLSYIQGFWDSWTPIDFTMDQISNLIPQMKSLRADYVIVDLGAGALEPHLNLFRAADEKFLVTTPEPTSIEKTYRFIEAYVCDSLKQNATPDAYGDMISTLRSHRQRTLAKPFSFRSYLKDQTGLHYDFFEALTSSPVRLIVNSSRSQANAELGHSMKSVCNKYYDLGLDYVAGIDYDNAVWQSVKGREHVLVAQPFTPLAGQFLATCKQLIDPEELRAVV